MKRRSGPLLATVLVALVVPASATAGGSASTREFEGTVTSVDRDARTFRLRDDGRIVTIKVTRSTRFERIKGFSSLKAGMKRVDADVRRVDGRWVARRIERSGRDRDDDDRDDDHGGPGPG